MRSSREIRSALILVLLSAGCVEMYEADRDPRPDAGAPGRPDARPCPDAHPCADARPSSDATAGPDAAPIDPSVGSIEIITPSLGGRTIFADDNAAVRTLTIDHDGDSLWCSRDGGATFSDCSDNVLVWEAADYHALHVVRSETAGREPIVRSFTPSSLLPGLELVTCTAEVTSSEPASTFNTRVASEGAVVCLADGVLVTGAVVIGANDVTVLVRWGDAASIVATGAHAIDVADRSNATLVGLLAATSGGTLTAGVQVDGTSGSVRIHDSTISCDTNNCYILRIVRGSAVVRRSILRGGSTSGAYSYGAYSWAWATVEIHDSLIDSSASAINTTVGSTTTITGSTLISRYPSVSTHTGAIAVYNTGANLHMIGSTIRTAGLPAVRVGGATTSGRVTLDGNMVRKTAGTAAGEHDVLLSIHEGSVFNSSVANTFCNEGSSASDGELSSTLITGAYDTTTSTFYDVPQNGVSDCSDFD